MTEAEQAVRKAAAELPEALAARFAGAEPLSDADRATLLQIAGDALAGFQPKPEASQA